MKKTLARQKCSTPLAKNRQGALSVVMTNNLAQCKKESVKVKKKFVNIGK
jgi:hypothetical protein